MYLMAITGGYTLIDTNFREIAEQYRWFIDRDGYATTFVKDEFGQTAVLRLHQLIKGKAPIGAVTDHSNRVKLDNRLHNLQFVTPLQNRHNRGVQDKTDPSILFTDYELRNCEGDVERFLNGNIDNELRFRTRELVRVNLVESNELYPLAQNDDIY